MAERHAARRASLRASLPLLLGLLGAAAEAGAGVYQWTDDDGRVHFGDRPPPEVRGAASDLSERYAVRRGFEVAIVPHDWRMGLDVRAKVGVAVSKILTVYAVDFGIVGSGDAALEIHVWGRADEYRALTERLGVPVENASGFYSPQDNVIHVRANRDLDRLLAVITHEASHAVIRHHVGAAPPWLNEGLAEYFETMEIFGQTVVVRPNPTWLERVAARLHAGPDPLANFLSLDSAQFYAYNGADSASYAISWSVAFFLMTRDEGIAALRALLQHYAADGTDDAPAIIGRTWPGGFAAFADAWRAWVLYGEWTPRRY